MNLWQSLAGMVTVELTSAEPEQALCALGAAGIEILEIQKPNDLTFRFSLQRREFHRLEVFCQKRGETLRLVRRRGIYWLGRRMIARPVLLAGMLLLFLAALYLPTRVFFVKVEGNAAIPSRQILSSAEECGIRFGASRRSVRSEKMKNALLSAIPQLQWAGVNTSGCVAVISVRERTEPPREEQNWEVSSIVAARDGYILSGTVTSGNPLFQVGQSVKEGQLLVSGYTDCGLCIRAERSEGEIFAQTKRCLEVVTPAQCRMRRVLTGEKKKISLLIGKNRINLWKYSGILDATCGRMYEEYYLSLPGGFQLPIALCVEEYTLWETEYTWIPLEDAVEHLKAFADAYLVRQMIAGSILVRMETAQEDTHIHRLSGEYVCSEMIGRIQQEEIGEKHGKDS